MSALDIPEAVHPHKAKAGTVYITIPIGHGQHVMVAETHVPQVTARVAAAQAIEDAIACRREAVRT